jgi:hypothetical protein
MVLEVIDGDDAEKGKADAVNAEVAADWTDNEEWSDSTQDWKNFLMKMWAMKRQGSLLRMLPRRSLREQPTWTRVPCRC